MYDGRHITGESVIEIFAKWKDVQNFRLKNNDAKVIYVPLDEQMDIKSGE